MRQLGLTIGLLSLCLVSSLAMAKDCDLLLQDGLRTYKGSSYDYYAFQRTQGYLRTSSATTKQDAEDDAANLGLGIEDVFNLKFGSASSSDNFLQWKQDFLNATFRQYREHVTNTKTLDDFSAALAEAFDKCTDEDYGTKVWIDALNDRDFTFFMKFVPPQGSSPKESYVTIKNIQPQNATCTGISSFITKHLSSVQPVVCRKTDIFDSSSVVLKAIPHGPEHNPTFPYFVTPPQPQTPNSYTINGTLTWVSRIDRDVGPSQIIARPSPQALAAAPQRANFSWGEDFPISIPPDEHLVPNTGKITEFPGNPVQCSLSNSSVTEQRASHQLIVHADTQCYLFFSPRGFGRNTKSLLARYGHSYYWSARLERLAPGEPLQINSPAETKTSWIFPYTGAKLGGGLLAFNVTLTPVGSGQAVTPVGSGQAVTLFLNADGRKNLAGGPFLAYLTIDDQLLIERNDDRAASFEEMVKTTPARQVQ